MTRALAVLLPAQLIAPGSSLNRQISDRREVHVVRLDVGMIRSVANQHSAKVNDVVLTIVCGGLHALLAGRGELSETTELHALVPVGLGLGTRQKMGNKVSAFFVRLPVHEQDPRRALQSIATAVKSQKKAHQEAVPVAALRLLDPSPQSVLAEATRLIRVQPVFNITVTNIPGPNVPLYALGARMLEAIPIVPLVGNEGLAVAALSYLDRLNLGVFSVPDVCPDVQVFCDGAAATLQRLSRSPADPPP